MHPNARLIESFYTAFQQLDAETMVACYAPDVEFSDPVFSLLRGEEAKDMWRMLISKSVKLTLTFEGVEADDTTGRAHWVALYTFSQTNRRVINRIDASFTFRDGKIVKHVDTFSLWRWAWKALGIKGMVAGWSPLIQGMIRKQAANALAAFREKKKQDAA